MPHPSKTKLFLCDLLLAVATDKRGLHDVITGRADGLEPAFDDPGGLCAFQHYVAAMKLGAIQEEYEHSVVGVLSDPDNITEILRAGKREPWGDGQRYRSFWSR